MRYFIWFAIGVCCFSCANRNENAKAEFEINEERILISNLEKRNLSLAELTSNKLYDYFELVELKNKHPEFEEDIKRQMHALTTDSLVQFNDTMVFSIANIHQVGEVLQESDTLQKLKLYYDVLQNRNIKKDSVFATVVSKSIFIDGLPQQTTKVTFSKSR